MVHSKRIHTGINFLAVSDNDKPEAALLDHFAFNGHEQEGQFSGFFTY